jgi:hypothetical protein
MSFVTYRRDQGISENTIAKGLIEMRAALYLAKVDGKWSGDLDLVFPRFETDYKPKRVTMTHDESWLSFGPIPRPDSLRGSWSRRLVGRPGPESSKPGTWPRPERSRLWTSSTAFRMTLGVIPWAGKRTPLGKRSGKRSTGLP